MGRDDQQHDAPEQDDGESHAADEPTAVWDENALRAAGLDLWRKKDEGVQSPPATVPKAPVEQSIVVEENLDAAPKAVLAKPVFTPQPAGLGWGTTIGIALALGAIAYAIMRFVKG